MFFVDGRALSVILVYFCHFECVAFAVEGIRRVGSEDDGRQGKEGVEDKRRR